MSINIRLKCCALSAHRMRNHARNVQQWAREMEQFADYLLETEGITT